MAEEILDVAAVAELTGLKPASVRQHLFRGTIPPPDYRVSGRPAWRPETIRAWLKVRRSPGKPAQDDVRQLTRADIEAERELGG
jgi:predicted DNA-binding transcriptional regulator AlpA